MKVVDRWLSWLWQRQRAYFAVLFGQKRVALDAYERLVALKPNDRIALATVGNLRMELGDAAGAAQAFETLLVQYPDDAESWFNLGYIYEHEDKLAEAERCFRRAIALKPSIDRAWYGLALVLIRTDRLHEAVEALKKNIELQPFSPYGYYQLGMTYHHLGEAGDAWRIYEKLKSFEPKYAATLKRDLENTVPRSATQSSLREVPFKEEATANAH
ncbi:MAG: tetratricopeptide repeat protein [Sutterellaceae bacterium]|nr:tetratricopeptide repeat protein [Burkholderiaceae bacterium]MCX7902166.1 tetratricopeptide repeat protein [Burkholderiaceae bacterium]MDW8430743.1 tetratricopeptide repeat protein [Sutterellaceae bacterium]